MKNNRPRPTFAIFSKVLAAL